MLVLLLLQQVQYPLLVSHLLQVELEVKLQMMEKSAVQQNSKVKTANIHCGSMLQGNKEMGPGQRGEGMFCGHVAFAIMILQAPITELKAICWGCLVNFEHVNQ
jgi:hypothetical protein